MLKFDIDDLLRLKSDCNLIAPLLNEIDPLRGLMLPLSMDGVPASIHFLEWIDACTTAMGSSLRTMARPVDPIALKSNARGSAQFLSIALFLLFGASFAKRDEFHSMDPRNSIRSLSLARTGVVPVS